MKLWFEVDAKATSVVAADLPRYAQHGGFDDGDDVYMKLSVVGDAVVLHSIHEFSSGNVLLEVRTIGPVRGPLRLGPNGDYYLGVGRHDSSAAQWDAAVTRARAVFEKIAGA